MLILRLWNYIRGYVIIIVEGYFLEKFINICTHRQLRLWNVKWHKNSKVKMMISIKDFRMLRPIARKTRCRVHIIRKKGFPFILDKYRNRKPFVIGLGICITAFLVISSFIWDISVTGNSRVPTDLIIEKLSDNGVKVGTLKYRINPEYVVGNMMLELNDLARISVYIHGTKIQVVVNERVKPPDLINRNIPCDIVALKEGVISSVVAKEGLEAVKIGDTVIKGQLLITGKVENIKNPESEPLMVHSMGSVKARTWYEASAKVVNKLTRTKRTGMKKENYSIVLFTKKFKLFHGKNPYNNSEHVELKKQLCIGKYLALPFEIITDQYYEYNLEKYEIDIEAAEEIASEKAAALAKQKVPENAEIVKTDISFVNNDNGESIANAVIECIEEIGVTREIGGM
ncbi:hypothetical protein LY28_01405 [Ruminiclostridium sufflavum DSM 19573]|uniref:Stage IV sporulation protein n=1 Tax=Ruminiclostridium sufflavum DSM 19573 TaxID=1121337 RepID=A0A318Y8K9_9FIRM|nr:sporulation protein YqfD [Ruminiclostridium sufflavum]PYG88554.1 hypothetical protein LY28_01405 [Ruminiclostridium sufflavum DSM 19573]